MQKTWKILLLGGIVLGGILLFSSHFLLPKQGNQTRGKQTLSLCAGRENCSIEVAGGKENRILHVLVADSKEERIQGLSYREQIPLDGMLFIFPSPKKYSFWMKDMSFPLDIIWIDENGKVVGFKENALPQDYPETYQAPTPVPFVLELEAGSIQKLPIHVGDIIHPLGDTILE